MTYKKHREFIIIQDHKSSAKYVKYHQVTYGVICKIKIPNCQQCKWNKLQKIKINLSLLCCIYLDLYLYI